MDSQVLIIGAGPVGLTMAIELGRRGINVLLVDKRSGFGKLPKMERCNARTMENFRRMGISAPIRAAGLDNDMPMDIFICLENLVNPPLVHHTYASVSALCAEYQATTDGSTAAEPYQLISQYTLEPLLRDLAERYDNVRIVFGHELVDFTQDDTGVTAQLRLADGTVTEARTEYLVGCDGASSAVRERLGFMLEGESLLQMRQALFYSEDLLERIPIGVGRHYHIADDTNSFMIVQDDKKHFSLHATVASDEKMASLFERIVGFPIKYEQLYVGGWRQRLMLANRYSDHRVFLAGDSAHLVIPTGGLGMNTGHADAVDLSWKLAAVLRGWGGPALLDSYEAERRPIGARNIAASRRAAKGRRAWREQWRAEIAEDSPAGEAVRIQVIAVAEREQRWSNDLYGIELGYQYTNSQILMENGGGTTMADIESGFVYRPVVQVGYRLPNTWMRDGRSIQDVIGDEYALIVNKSEPPRLDLLEKEFRRIGAPLRVVLLDTTEAIGVYGNDLLLVRPDLHIAWRAAELPDDPAHLVATLTGNYSKSSPEGFVSSHRNRP
jgi:2-polyprenyl-6-methoxyphenol hydroxylase-like FAD-dependent oxidoreductase